VYGGVHRVTSPLRSVGVSISADSYNEEDRAFLDKANQLRALAAETESGTVQKLYLLLAESYGTLAGPGRGSRPPGSQSVSGSGSE
jgi:hypothetical protein